jgi:hypothetical protein
MAAVSEHLERLRAKPHHVRRQIAFGTSLAVTALVAVGWMGALLSSPKLAIERTPGGSEDVNFQESLTETRSNFSDLLGAAGAAIGATTTPSKVIVVDTKTTSTMDVKRDNYNDTRETVIPF